MRFDKGLRIKIFWCFIFTTTMLSASWAQLGQTPLFRKQYIDEVIFPTTQLNESVLLLLNKGYRAFLVTGDKALTPSDVEDVRLFLKKNPKSFLAFLFEAGNKSGDNFISSFRDKLIQFPEDQLPLQETLLAEGRQLLVLDEKGIVGLNSNTYLTSVEMKPDSLKGYVRIMFVRKPSNLFTLMSYASIDSMKDLSRNNPILFYLKRTGKFANFTVTHDPGDVEKWISQLPYTLKVEVTNNQKDVLSNVGWVGSDFLYTYGIAHLTAGSVHFSKDSNRYFGRVNAQPQKDGYRFSPQLFTFNRSNYSKFKNFTAQKLSLEQGLIFGLNLKDLKTPKDIEIIEEKINIVDDLNGPYANFNGIDDNLNFSTKTSAPSMDNFTISCWIKPTKISQNYALLSCNDNFVIKIRKKHLSLTIPGLKDFSSVKLQVDSIKWQHIAITVVNQRSVRFFKNGEFIEEFPLEKLPLKWSDQFIVGYDQWDEYFEGGIKSLFFWDRSLSNEEIKKIYDGWSYNGFTYGWWWIFILIFLLGIAIYIFRKMKMSLKLLDKPALTQQPMQLTIGVQEQNCLFCFGDFSLYDETGNELLQEVALKKRLFIFVIHYFTQKEGGISPADLTDILWPGYDAQAAKNVRSTYLQNIRSVIGNNLLEINYGSKKWVLELKSQLKDDLSAYFVCQSYLTKAKEKGEAPRTEYIKKYLETISRGSFLKNITADSIQKYKNEVNAGIIDMLEFLISNPNQRFCSHEILQMLDILMQFDSLHENALFRRIQILVQEGQKNKAYKYLEYFSKEWKQTYNEDFKVTTEITDILTKK